MQRLTAFIAIIFVLSIWGCTKDATEDQMPTLSVHSPADQSQYKKGEAVNISLQAWDDIMLNDVHIRIVNMKTGQETYDVHDFPEEKDYGFSGSYRVTEDSDTPLSIKIKVRDSEQQYITEEINLFVE